jgi:hypothetical protein
MNVGPKWRMMDHKWAGECALRCSGVAYSIVRPGALWLTPSGAGGSSGPSYVVSCSQAAEGSLRGRVSKSDLASICASCALDQEAALNATFDVVQLEPPTLRPPGEGGRWEALRGLASDEALGGVRHTAWLGLFGTEVSLPAPQAEAQRDAPAAKPGEERSPINHD